MAKLTLTQIIQASEKKMSVEDKLVAIIEKVNKARKKYGNTEAEIAVPSINGTDGVVSMEFLSDKDKVAAAASEIRKIRAIATEKIKATEGSALDSEVARLIAVNPVLVNLSVSSDSEFI